MRLAFSRRRTALQLAVFTLALAVAGALDAAYACACCAEPGTRFFYDLELDQSEIDELARLRAKGPARLYLTACGSDCVEGISAIAERYEADFRITDGVLRIAVRQPAGSISMVLPGDFTQFGVDTEPMAPGYARRLYNEFTYAGKITADGIFAAADQAGATLILAGKANLCWSAGDYSHWILQVRGAGARFQLYGGLTLE